MKNLIVFRKTVETGVDPRQKQIPLSNAFARLVLSPSLVLSTSLVA